MKERKIHIPGSKYIANRALLISTLTNGKSSICNVPDNQDIGLLLRALSSIGVCFSEVESKTNKEKKLEVWGIKSSCSNLKKIKKVDVGESGTLLRFTLGIACLLDGETSITAGDRNRERPIRPLIKALKDLGAGITETPGKEIYPLRIKKGLIGGRTVISGDVSSQFISSLLIVSPCSEKDVEIKVMKPIVSSGYIDLTIKEMRTFGVTARRIRNKNFDLFSIKAGQKYLPRIINIPGDWSSANYLLAASVILNREIKINRIDTGSNPGESEFAFILERMGCKISVKPDSISILNSKVLQGVEVDMKDSPDSVLTLIAVALFANGTTAIKNISHLIYKESDRIKQVEKELRKIGADIRTTKDSIIIAGQKLLHAAITECHNDHRLAMSLGLIQLKNRDMKIENKECVQKSFPEYWEYISMIDREGEKCLEIQ